jgi:hypothetical protein
MGILEQSTEFLARTIVPTPTEGSLCTPLKMDGIDRGGENGMEVE